MPEGRRHTEGAQSINRAAGVLRVLGTYGERGALLMEVARACGLHKATAHRILSALADERLVERVAETRRYRLGVEVFALAASMGERFNLKSLARPALERLAALTGDTLYLGIRNGYDGLCLDRCEGNHPEKTLTLSVMDRWPLGVGAFSMALLAYLPDADVAEIIERNRKRLVGQELYTPERLHQKVIETRRQGYAYNEVRVYPGMSGVGVPILDADDHPIASLCAVAVVARMGPKRRAEIAKLLWSESRHVSQLYLGRQGVRPRMESWRKIGRGDTPLPVRPAHIAVR